MDTCFANPGTTELAFVRSFEEVAGWHTVPCLFEGVCTGGADGYGRMLGRPALTLTHLGPGFANGIANLHNAKRALTPIVNVIGDHTTAHRPFDAPLTSDIPALAGVVSGWVTTVRDARDAAHAAREAVAKSQHLGGATVIFPADLQAAAVPQETERSIAAPARVAPETVDDVDRVASRLRTARAPMLVVGGHALANEDGLAAAQRIAAATHAAFYCETFPARIERGAGLPAPERFPYFPEPAFAAVEQADVVVVAGIADPITYFGYAGYPSRIVPAEKLLRLAGPAGDASARLIALAEALHAPAVPLRAEHDQGVDADAPLAAADAAQTVARWLPENAIVSIEGGTCGYPFFTASARARRHTVLTNTGGAIGQGLPVALGAAVAAPGRRTVALQSDGSAQYTVQALWSMAHESLPVTILIAANHRYGVLQNELQRDGLREIRGAAAELTDLGRPRVDWVALAAAYGVPGTRVGTTTAALRAALDASLATAGPTLIAMELP